MNRHSSRREFLRLGALATASFYSTSLSSLAQELVRSGPAKRVVIIGAGLAGLTAAYELSQAGHDVTVLEAQGRPGGRVRTLRDPLADGLYAELGAARIPDNHEWTIKYVKLFGLALTPFYPTTGRSTTFLRNIRAETEPGAEPDLRLFHSEAGRPEGHIHFAGEHTSSWFAWMNGAIESGSRAAHEVNNA